MSTVKLLLLCSSVQPVLDFFLLQQCVGTSLLDSWTPTKACSSVGDCQNQRSREFSGGPVVRTLRFHC